jgi:hypothetical protein
MTIFERLSAPGAPTASDTQTQLTAVLAVSEADPVVIRIAIVPTAAPERFLMRIWRPVGMVCGLLVLAVIVSISLIGHCFADAKDFISSRRRG